LGAAAIAHKAHTHTCARVEGESEDRQGTDHHSQLWLAHRKWVSPKHMMGQLVGVHVPLLSKRPAGYGVDAIQSGVCAAP